MLRVAATIRDEWTRDALRLRYPDYRDLHAWEAFREASVDLAREYLATSIADELRDFFSPVGPEHLLTEICPSIPTCPQSPLTVCVPGASRLFPRR
jgi:hypothetical protein